MIATMSPKPRTRKRLRSHRWTRQELYDLCSAGWFHDKKVMLIDGRIYVMPMPNPPHDYALGTLDDYLRTVFSTGYHVRNQMGLGIGKRTDPGPDLAVVPGVRADFLNEHPQTAILVVEISESTLAIDLRVKPDLYALAGVPEYWVVDLVNRRVIVHRDPIPDAESPRGFRYASIISYTADASIAPQAKPTSTVQINSLLPPL
jgi:Uma2 family endonuclease